MSAMRANLFAGFGFRLGGGLGQHGRHPALDGTVKSNALISELNGLGPNESTGTTLQLLAGVRVATPWFGTGFNFCVGAGEAGGWEGT